MKKGFTLLEILITVGIAGVMGILITQVFFTTARTNSKTEILKDVKQNGEYALGIMERMIRNSLQVSSACGALGSTLSEIDILNPNGDTTTFACLVDGSVTRIASTSGTGATQFLTSSNVTIGNDPCTFVCTASVDRGSEVTISFSLSQAGSSLEAFETASVFFQTTASSRN